MEIRFFGMMLFALTMCGRSLSKCRIRSILYTGTAGAEVKGIANYSENTVLISAFFNAIGEKKS